MMSIEPDRGPTDEPNEVLLVVRDLTVQFATDMGWVTVVDGVSLDVQRGAVLGILGESGSGKSVTALAIAGLLSCPPARVPAGSVMFDGAELIGKQRSALNRILGEDIGFVFQEPATSLNPAFTIGEQIAEVYRRHRRVSRKEAWRRAVEMLDRVGIPAAEQRAHDFPHSFSGGMRQRAMIAAALVCEPKLIIADEPTTALDATVQILLLDLLRDLREEYGLTLVLITHDMGVIADICDQTIVMYGGHVVESASTIDLFQSPRHPYSEGLLQSIAGLDHGGQARGALWSIPGTVPLPSALPPGCRFHPRCAYVMEGLCTTDRIELTTSFGRTYRCVRGEELRLGLVDDVRT